MPMPLKTMKGRTFRDLTILSHDHTERRGSFWNAICRCGKKRLVCASDVRAGRVISCGHLEIANRAGWAWRMAALRRQRAQEAP
jgi:hypothetical protein